MRIVPGAICNEWRKARSTNATDSAFPSRVPTTTEPVGEGVIDLRQQTPVNLALLFYGTGADNATFDARVIGWQKVGGLWVPVTLLQAACTLSAAVGVALAEVTNSERFADTITLSLIASSGVDAWAKSPTNDTIGMALADVVGMAKAEVIFDLGTATGANALVKEV